jgi:predicted Zn-dependent protease
MSRLARTSALISALALLAAVPALASARSDAPTAQAARSCHLTIHQQQHLGTTYVTSLRVSGTSCRNGRTVVKSFNSCRHEHHHRAGSCHHRVHGYRCREHRYNKSRFSYDSLTKCKKSGRQVAFRYTQNT